MRITVQRKWLTDTSTVGRISVNGADSFFSMERASTDPLRIPAGEYTISLHTPNSSVLKATLSSMVSKWPSMIGVTQYPQLNSPAIAQRDPILIHPGNKPTDSDGCILAGMALSTLQGVDEITEAQLACAQLIPLIIAAVNSEGCNLTVTDPQ